jgi:microcystin-dependent protein
MANYAETKFNISGAFMTGLQGISTGLIIPWSSISIPSGFLECNGASVSTSTYASLFAVIGYTYGGSGASFNLPDLQDKTVVHRSNTKALATTMGANTVTPTGNTSGNLAPYALTTAEIAAHTHPNTSANSMSTMQSFSPEAPQSSNQSSGSPQTSQAGGGGTHSHTVSGTFTGDAQSTLQPYLTLLYIIKT